MKFVRPLVPGVIRTKCHRTLVVIALDSRRKWWPAVMYLVHFFQRDVSWNNLSTMTFNIRKVWISEEFFWKSVLLWMDGFTEKIFQLKPKLSQTFYNTSFVNLGGSLRPRFKARGYFSTYFTRLPEKNPKLPVMFAQWLRCFLTWDKCVSFYRTK